MGARLAAEMHGGTPLPKETNMVPRKKLRASMQTSLFELVLLQFPCMHDEACLWRLPEMIVQRQHDHLGRTESPLPF